MKGSLENGDPQNGDPLKSTHKATDEFIGGPRFSTLGVPVLKIDPG